MFVDESEKVMVLPVQIMLSGATPKLASNPPVKSTILVVSAKQPILLMVLILTLYMPIAGKVWFGGFCPLKVVASPKFHCQLKIEPPL